MKIKEDVLKQLLTKISQLESRIISLEVSVSSLETFSTEGCTSGSRCRQGSSKSSQEG